MHCAFQSQTFYNIGNEVHNSSISRINQSAICNYVQCRSTAGYIQCAANINHGCIGGSTTGNIQCATAMKYGAIDNNITIYIQIPSAVYRGVICSPST